MTSGKRYGEYSAHNKARKLSTVSPFKTRGFNSLSPSETSADGAGGREKVDSNIEES